MKQRNDLNTYRVSKSNPCRVCGRTDWCVSTDDWTLCQRIESPDRRGEGGWFHRHKHGVAKPAVKPSKTARQDDAPKPVGPFTYRGHSPSYIHHYNLKNGDRAYRKLRFERGTLDPERKVFRFEHWRNGEWFQGRGGYAQSLYRREQLPGRQTVYVVEGEKCADVLWDFGALAVCNDDGGGHWRASYSCELEGKDVIILPDNDEKGQAHAELVARELVGYARSIKIVNLPGLPPKGDVADFIGAVMG